jgi:hypothetical protein
MSERSRLKTSKGETNVPVNPKKPFDITKYVNPISIGTVISLISLGLYYKYKWDAWEYENLMKAKKCRSIEEAIELPGQYVSFVCEADAENLFVSKKITDGKPARAVIIKKETIKKVRTKNDTATEDEILSETIMNGPITLTDNKKRIKIGSNQYTIDDDKGIKLEQLIYQERMLPKKFRSSLKDPLAGKMYDSEKVLWPGTPLTAFGVIRKNEEGKFELTKEKSKPYYLTTKMQDQVISTAEETVHPGLFWTAVGTGGVGICILTAGIIKMYISQ